MKEPHLLFIDINGVIDVGTSTYQTNGVNTMTSDKA